MTQIGLIRHGSTLWNKTGRVQGLTDNPLDEEGREQARLLAERLREEKWDRIYSSDLLRARETAEIIAARLGIKHIEYDSRLREMNAGLIEGTTEEERRQKWGNDWKKLELGQESPGSGMERGAECIAEIARKHAGGHILIVSHGVLLRQSLRKLVPEIGMDAALDNTAITVLHLEGDHWNCKMYNGTDHLNGG
ncbi:histidine phosphatase family protein [Paenibacillus caui]|uniref:histidine phosphatase family protein n=1 Tax=Paenibacillus caui TaxID=2873927 RepID=UPI001CA90A01|nr:histidine phosphatase family protein [Paenibacillus caui]